MRIKPEQLKQTLDRSTPEILVVSGNEPLLIEECCDVIRAHYLQQEYSERLVYHAAKTFHWSVLDEHSQSFSLFGDKKLIEIRLETLPAEEGKKRLRVWAEHPPDDCCLLLVSNKIESGTLNTKWFKAIESHCLHIQIWPVNLHQLPRWINQRLQQAGFHPTSSAVSALSEHVEGNLLAARQEIEKLRLLKTDNQLDENDVLCGIASSNKYTVFNLIDACLENDQIHAVKIIQTLKAESFEPSIILWSLSREIRLLAKLYKAKFKGQSLESGLQKERVFKNKWGTYKKYLNQNNPNKLPKIHYYCQLSDKSIKGMEGQPYWPLLTHAVLILAGLDDFLNIEHSQ